MLKTNLEINKIKNTKICEVGISNKKDVINFQDSGTDGAKINPQGTGVISIDKLSNYLDKSVDF